MSEIQALTQRVQDLDRAANFWNSWYLGFVFCTVVFAIATFITQYLAMRRARQLASAQGTLMRVRDGALQAELREKDARISEANQKGSVAVEKAESEKLARIKLEKEIAPRRLTGEQVSALCVPLKGHPTPVAVVSRLFDTEASDFGNDISGALNECGWESKTFKNWTQSKYGVFVATTEGETSKAPEVKMLSDALAAIGVDNTIITINESEYTTSNPRFQPHVLYVLVGQKPPLDASTQQGKK